MSFRRVDMYGIQSATLEESRSLVEKALGIKLEEKHSSHFDGVSYQYKEQSFQEIRLYSNFDSSRSGFIYEHLRTYPVLLNVAGLDDMDSIQKKLLESSTGIKLIGSSTIDSSQANCMNVRSLCATWPVSAKPFRRCRWQPSITA